MMLIWSTPRSSEKEGKRVELQVDVIENLALLTLDDRDERDEREGDKLKSNIVVGEVSELIEGTVWMKGK